MRGYLRMWKDNLAVVVAVLLVIAFVVIGLVFFHHSGGPSPGHG